MGGGRGAERNEQEKERRSEEERRGRERRMSREEKEREKGEVAAMQGQGNHIVILKSPGKLSTWHVKTVSGGSREPPYRSPHPESRGVELRDGPCGGPVGRETWGLDSGKKKEGNTETIIQLFQIRDHWHRVVNVSVCRMCCLPLRRIDP